ncbi:sucrose transporter [Colletotrichum zoysiae]|uniref:Sucrose transporter n=1 Tax=Colletotrichum zoysiae TaxID=1216348 RepID=A0AAD9LTL3_9PEZI|nr:sucrose transporter [Colletotrichum zoysiae]
MEHLESLDLSDDTPLEEIRKIMSSSTSGDGSLPPASPGQRLEEIKYPSVSISSIIAYASPAMPIQSFFTMFTVYLIPYLTTDLGLTGSQVSLVLLATPLSGLIASPVFGIMCDRSGRRLIFYKTGALALASGQLILAWCPELGGGNLTGRWVSTVAVYISCVGVRACITGHRVITIDNIPPQQQPVFNLVSGLMSAGGAIGILAAGLMNPSFQLITAICATGFLLSVIPLWVVRPTERHQPTQEGDYRLGAFILSIPRTIWDAGRFLPPRIRHKATRGEGSETVPPDDTTRAGLRVLLIAQIGTLLLQTAVARSWEVSVSALSAGPLRRRMNEDVMALRRIWALAFVALGTSTLGAIVFRTSFMAASICAASIMTMSTLSGWVPLTIISYEAAVVQREKGQGSSGTFISLYEISITTGQALALVVNAIISFGLDIVQMHDKNLTAFLFPPAVVASFVAAVIC